MAARTKRNEALYARASYLDLIARLAATTRRLRTERGWTQAEAAHQCDMATFVYQTVEAGRENFSGTLIARLVDGFGVDVRELFAPAPPLAKRRRAPREPAESEASASELAGPEPAAHEPAESEQAEPEEPPTA